MSDFYDAQWYDDRWQSMPLVMRKIAADAIKKAISEEDQALIRRKYAEYGSHEWIHHLLDITMDAVHEDDIFTRTLVELGNVTMSAHHGFGTQIRNLLRDELGGGIQDGDLPQAPYEGGGSHQNWDDYYVQAIEAALGLRDV